MATDDQFIQTGHGIGSRSSTAQVVTLTMAAGVTATGSVTLPTGSWLSPMRFETATAFTGAPTNINLRVGNVAAGQQVVADTDVKAQGHISPTLVAAYDVQNPDTTLFFQLAATAGTNPAGTVNAIINYHPPVR